MTALDFCWDAETSKILLCYATNEWMDWSPVHVVLVSLLVDQLSSLFLLFFGRPKKNLFSLREFLVRLWFFWSTKFLFGIPKFLFSIPKNQSLTKKIQRLTKNSLRLNKFFFSRPKKVRNRSDNWSTKRLTKTTWTGLPCVDIFLPYKRWQKEYIFSWQRIGNWCTICTNQSNKCWHILVFWNK